MPDGTHRPSRDESTSAPDAARDVVRARVAGANDWRARCRRLLLRIERPFVARRFAAFGARSVLRRPYELVGPERIAIGVGVEIRPYARLSAFDARAESDGRPLADGPRLSIGDGTIVHPFAHLAAARRVTIGERCLFAAHVYVSDHDHAYDDPDDPPVSNGVLTCAPVSIGACCWFGERVCVLKGVTIGEHAIVGAGSIVTRDVPAFSIAVGAPARVVRRYDHDRGEWVATGDGSRPSGEARS